MAEGIETRHARECPRADNRAARCKCKPRYRGTVWSARDRALVRGPWRGSMAEAKTWRIDAQRRAASGTLRGAAGKGALTVRAAGHALILGMERGEILNRSGDAYKPSVTRTYGAALELYVYPDLGPAKLGAVTRADVQALVERMRAKAKNPSTIRNALMPLRVIYRRALREGLVAVSPVEHVELPAVRGRRERIATPAEAAQLIAALESPWDRALWGTALYAGLRRGELRGLRWSDVDMGAGLIRICRSMDAVTDAAIEPKSRAGVRVVPIIGALRDLLTEHAAAIDPARTMHALSLVFPGPAGGGFPIGGKAPWIVRAPKAWKAAGLEPIGLHECRHTYASLLIAAGANAKTISTLMGHSSITITFDRYGHLMPGGEDAAGALLDALLAGDAAPETDSSPSLDRDAEGV